MVCLAAVAESAENAGRLAETAFGEGTPMPDCVQLGLLAPPEFPAKIADEIASSLPKVLHERVSGDVTWDVPVVSDLRDANSISGVAMIDAARIQMLDEGWDLAISLTDLPISIGRRPVVADASATHSVAIICLPALGARHIAGRATDAIVRLVGGLMGQSMELTSDREARDAKANGRLREIAAPARTLRTEPGHVRMVTGVIRGHFRLIAGMVRANRPWRLVAHMSRALAVAGGAVALALANQQIWQIADGLGAARLAGLTFVAVVALSAWLIVDHELWERPKTNARRRQAILFNTATTLTVAIGVGVLYLALIVLGFAGAEFLLANRMLARALGHGVNTVYFLHLAWLAASVGTIAGALGSGFESDDVVRQAAYGYRTERHSEQDSARDRRDVAGGGG